MQARYYDPAVGRFTQLDPVRYGPETFATGQNNRWTYCANDPVNLTDPTGLIAPLLIIIALVFFAIGFAMGLLASPSSSTVPGAAFGAVCGTLAGMTWQEALGAGSLFSISEAVAAAGFFPVVGLMLASFGLGFALGLLTMVVYDAIYNWLVLHDSARQEHLQEYTPTLEYYMPPEPHFA